MPSSCCAPGCARKLVKGNNDVKMYRFPLSDSDRLDKWIVKIGRLPPPGQTSTRADGLWEPKEHDRVCNAHFVSGRPSKEPTDLDYVPTLFQHTPISKRTPLLIKQKVQRQERVKERAHVKEKSAAALALLCLSESNENVPTGVATQTVNETRDFGTQTDLDFISLSELFNIQDSQRELINQQAETVKHVLQQNRLLTEQFTRLCDSLKELKSKIKSLEQANSDLADRVKNCLSYSFIMDSDDKTQYYTGLPNYATFMVFYEHSKKHVKRKNTKLDLKDELLLTLVKLRLNLGNEDLGYRFGVSCALVTRIFHAWLNALYISVGGLVMWPPLDKELQLPEVFNNKDFNKVKCIIDCTEIFIERPSALKARAQTYSNYKRHNTIKVLVGISPSGSVTFLSECWGGRASDKKITMDSGILDKLVPGDVVMADRGFIMKEEFAQRGVKLIVPAFTKGKSQLSPAEVETSRQMSRARIHVERVIGRLKDFKIISGTMPISLVKKQCCTYKILHVVGGIVNTNSPLL